MHRLPIYGGLKRNAVATSTRVQPPYFAACTHYTALAHSFSSARAFPASISPALHVHRAVALSTRAHALGLNRQQTTLGRRFCSTAAESAPTPIAQASPVTNGAASEAVAAVVKPKGAARPRKKAKAALATSAHSAEAPVAPAESTPAVSAAKPSPAVDPTPAAAPVVSEAKSSPDTPPAANATPTATPPAGATPTATSAVAAQVETTATPPATNSAAATTPAAGSTFTPPPDYRKGKFRKYDPTTGLEIPPVRWTPPKEPEPEPEPDFELELGLEPEPEPEPQIDEMEALVLGSGTTPQLEQKMQGILAALRDNWYSTLEDVKNISEGEALQLKIPLKLLASWKREIENIEARKEAKLKEREDARKRRQEDIARLRREREEAKNPKPKVMRIRGKTVPRDQPDTAVMARRDKRRTHKPWGLTDKTTSPELKQEFKNWETWMTQRFYGQQEARISKASAHTYIIVMKNVLGWIKRYKLDDVDLTNIEAKRAEIRKQLSTLDKTALIAKCTEMNLPSDGFRNTMIDRIMEVKGKELEGKCRGLSLKTVFPSSGREDAKIAFEYLQWTSKERLQHPNTESKAMNAFKALAKYLFHTESKADPTAGDKPYSDLPIIRELRKLHHDVFTRTKVAPRAFPEAHRWLSWPEYLKVVDKLREEVGDLKKNEATTKNIALAYQTYLAFAILSCIPDRQRTLRELRVGKTLQKLELAPGEGLKWAIIHGPEDYKTGKSYGSRTPLIIADHIVPYLEDYLENYRAAVLPANDQHDYVFTNTKGTPAGSAQIYRLFTHHTYRLTGQRMNPHLVRDSIVTHVRSTDASQRELEALALYMAHSLNMQKGSYDRRTKAEKVAPALTILNSMLTGAKKN